MDKSIKSEEDETPRPLSPEKRFFDDEKSEEENEDHRPIPIVILDGEYKSQSHDKEAETPHAKEVYKAYASLSEIEMLQRRQKSVDEGKLLKDHQSD